MHPYSNERLPVTSFFPCVLPQNYYTLADNQSQQQSQPHLVPAQQNQEDYVKKYSNYNPISVNMNVGSCLQTLDNGSAIQQGPDVQRRAIVDNYNMPIPQVVLQNCPIGLNYLSTISQLFVSPQKAEVKQAIFNFGKINKYTMMNSTGQKIYYAVEEDDCCTRNICGSLREFEIKIIDIYDNELIHLSRRYACQSCFFPCCLQKIEIFSPPGRLVGTVEQNWSIFAPMFTIRNEINEEVLKIKGPTGRHRTHDSDLEFKILSKHETTGVGHISKQLPECLKETLTDANSFGMTFPTDLDIRMKAVIIGASFLINFMFFENKNKN